MLKSVSGKCNDRMENAKNYKINFWNKIYDNNNFIIILPMIVPGV